MPTSLPPGHGVALPNRTGVTTINIVRARHSGSGAPLWRWVPLPKRMPPCHHEVAPSNFAGPVMVQLAPLMGGSCQGMGHVTGVCSATQLCCCQLVHIWRNVRLAIFITFLLVLTRACRQALCILPVQRCTPQFSIARCVWCRSSRFFWHLALRRLCVPASNLPICSNMHPPSLT